MKTWVYIDGFNLYYGAVKDTPYKWLDVHHMCELLLRDHEVARIKYFTARVSARSDDPTKPTRQQIYLRALRTLPGLEIIFGRFLSHDVMMPLTQPIPGGAKFAKVVVIRKIMQLAKGADVPSVGSHCITCRIVLEHVAKFVAQGRVQQFSQMFLILVLVRRCQGHCLERTEVYADSGIREATAHFCKAAA